jgi:methyl-accepting chemotaxis protein
MENRANLRFWSHIGRFATGTPAQPMVQDSDYEHQFLDLKGEGMDDRTFLGRTSLSARTTMFVMVGIFALIALAGIFIYVDQRLAGAINDARHARDIGQLTGRVEAGIARARSLEKVFILDKQPALAESFAIEIDAVEAALDGLVQFPEAAAQRQHIATLRDGIAQYDQQFGEFVRAEEALGLTTETGLSHRLHATSQALVKGFTEAKMANLADQIIRIDREGQETLRSTSEQGVTEIKERYKALQAFLDASRLPAKRKADLGNMITAHETDMLTMLNSRFALERERGRFGEITAYMDPSLDSLIDFSADLATGAARRLDRAQAFSRYMIGGSTVAIVLWFMFAGMILLRSVFGPVRGLADAAARLAGGDRGAPIPARGNIDATGQIARALDKWADDLVDVDMVRRQLEQTQSKMENVAQEAERKAHAAAEAAKAAILADLEAPEPPPVPEPEPEPEPEIPAEAQAQRRPPPPPPEPRYDLAGGPISTVSQQLTHFSEYVSAAAHDVERTEALVRSLSEATQQIDLLGSLVTAMRDQVNLLAFRSSPRDYGGGENLVHFNADERPATGGFDDPVSAGRLDAIRETTERAERALQGVRHSVDNVSVVAQDIASTASHQAMEATNKLLAQSQYLQNMLDDIMTRIRPSPYSRLTAPEPRDQQQPPGWQGTPPRRR